MITIWIINQVIFYEIDASFALVCFIPSIAAVVPFWQQMALRALFAETWRFLLVLFIWNKNIAIFFLMYVENVKILLFCNAILIIYGIQVVFAQFIKSICREMFLIDYLIFCLISDEFDLDNLFSLFEWAID